MGYSGWVVGTQVLRAFLFAGDVPAARGARAINARSMRGGAGRAHTKIFRAPEKRLGGGPVRPVPHRDDARPMRSMHPINGVDRT
jgi:hypothetical protein